jgi:hypothetical protein
VCVPALIIDKISPALIIDKGGGEEGRAGIKLIILFIKLLIILKLSNNFEIKIF